MSRCTNCVLPETTPHISFDDKCVCNFCHRFSKFQYQGEQALLSVLDSVRQSEGQYDCIVGLSGGRDSTYTLLKLKKDYDLDVLAVNYDNPFTDPQAKENIRNAVDILNVDLISFQLKNRIHERILKNNLLAWLKKPSPAMIPMLCVACKSYFWDVLEIAKDYDVKCIAHGGDPFEDTAFKKELLNINSEEKIEDTFIKSIMGVLKETVRNPRYLHPICIPTMVKGYLFGDPYTLGSRVYGKHIQRIDLFHYLEWNENEIISRISSELKWDYPRKFASCWRFDCRIGHLKDFLYLSTLGLTERDDLYSKMVRQGILTRDEALARLKRENQIYYDEIFDILEQIGIRDYSIFDSLPPISQT